jgi:ribA/ribD-fused uncharacterized protein
MAQEQINQEVEFFRGYKYVLSNFYYCDLTIDGEKFNTSEKAYQVLKAKFHGDSKIEEELMKTHFVSQVKKISEKIKVKPEWIDHRVDVMRKVLRAKADNCTTYRKKLLNCKGLIVEAIKGDLFWSAGLDENDLRNMPKDKWPGQNVLGQLHMELRDEIQEFLRTQSQSKKRTAEYKEFVGKKKQRVVGPSLSLDSANVSMETQIQSPTEDYEWKDPSFNFETAFLNPTLDDAMFKPPPAAPITPEENDAVEDFLQSVAANIDSRLVIDNANKSKLIFFSHY